MNQLSLWRDHDHWQCMRHVPPIILPAKASRCWMERCSDRPQDSARPEPPEPVLTLHPIEETAPTCAYEACEESARDGSKYCSRACSNRNARKRHKERALR